MNTIEIILVVVIINLALRLISNYTTSGKEKLMFAYLENNEKNIQKMEKDLEELDFLIRQRISSF